MRKYDNLLIHSSSIQAAPIFNLLMKVAFKIELLKQITTISRFFHPCMFCILFLCPYMNSIYFKYLYICAGYHGMHVDYPEVRAYILYFLQPKSSVWNTDMEVNGSSTIESVSHFWSLQSNNDNRIMYSDQEGTKITAS